MPILHLFAGPNGAGKSSYVRDVLHPVIQLPFVNADLIAAQRWPTSQAEHAYDAARVAAAERLRLMAERRSFITETVFSHPSKIDLVDQAVQAGYMVHLHVIMAPLETTIRRVAERVRRGGHHVPESKIRGRYERLWPLVARARGRADRADFFDNSVAATPFRMVAGYEWGKPVGIPEWPDWTPAPLRS
jgi:predicted ABC-type ATPase